MTVSFPRELSTLEVITPVRNQPRWFQNPLLLPAIVFVFGVFWLAELGKLPGMTGPLVLVLLAQVVLFIFLLRRPVWAVAALIVGQLTASNYMLPLGGTLFSMRLMWAILAFMLLVYLFFKNGKIVMGGRARRIIIPALIFFIVTTVANYVNSDIAITIKEMRYHITSLIILFLIPAAVENEKDLKRLAIVTLVTCSASAVFAVLQRLSLTSGVPVFEIYNRSFVYGRVQGLSESSIQLAYNLPMILLPLAAFFYFGGLSSRARMLLVLISVVIGIALFFTLTRSGLYSLAPGLLLLGLLVKGKARIFFFLAMAVLSAAILLIVNTHELRYDKGFTDDGSAAGRLVLWQAGINIALDHPVLGIGGGQFKEVSLEYASTIDPVLFQTQGAGKALGIDLAHNDFLSVWSSFGTVALLAFLLIFINIFRNYLEAYRKSKTPFLRALSIGCFAAMLAYIANAAIHNVMGSSMLLWIMGGLSIAVVKVAMSRRSPPKVVP